MRPVHITPGFWPRPGMWIEWNRNGYNPEKRRNRICTPVTAVLMNEDDPIDSIEIYTTDPVTNREVRFTLKAADTRFKRYVFIARRARIPGEDKLEFIPLGTLAYEMEILIGHGNEVLWHLVPEPHKNSGDKCQ